MVKRLDKSIEKASDQAFMEAVDLLRESASKMPEDVSIRSLVRLACLDLADELEGRVVTTRPRVSRRVRKKRVKPHGEDG